MCRRRGRSFPEDLEPRVKVPASKLSCLRLCPVRSPELVPGEFAGSYFQRGDRMVLEYGAAMNDETITADGTA